MFCVILPVLRKLRKNAQNSLRFMRKRCAKVRKKKICAKIAQILRNKYSHFVETLLEEEWQTTFRKVKWHANVNYQISKTILTSCYS